LSYWDSLNLWGLKPLDYFSLLKLVYHILVCGAARLLMLDGDSLILLDVMKVVFTKSFILSRYSSHWHTQPAVRRAEPSMPLLLILALFQ
jgi:hypothetical protein